MSDLPELPSQISTDGREIWDWAANFSRYTHRQNKMRQIRDDIARVGKRCGDCEFWMQSKNCPREYNDNGCTRGPSCDGSPCGKFSECRFATKRRADLTAELAALQSTQETP